MTSIDRGRTISALEDAWRSLRELTEDLDDDEWATPTDCPGWSVADTVVHIIGTERMLAGEEVPDVEIGDVAHVRNPIGEFNERWIVARRGATPAELRAELAEVTAARRAVLDAMEDHEWEAEAWTPAGPDSYGRFMRIRVLDTWMHDGDIRRATGREEVVSGPAFEAALDEMAVAMPYAVAKLGGAPDGSRVELRITGPSPRTIRVSVGGRGRLVDDFGGAEPTATLTMGAAEFRRVAGGRVDPSTVQPAITGDDGIALRIFENLGYMI